MKQGKNDIFKKNNCWIGGREEDKILISCMDNLFVSYWIINCQTSCQINNLSINLTLELILETKGYTLVGEM